MGFLGSGKSLESVIEDRKRGARIGVIQKAMHDAKPPEEGVTKLLPRPEDIRDKLWKKKAQRFQYRKGMVLEIEGEKVNVGGRFTTAPDNAPLRRKRKKPRR